VHTLGCVVNKQRRSRREALYSYYYTTDEETELERLHTSDLRAFLAPDVPPDAPPVDEPVEEDLTVVKTVALPKPHKKTEKELDAAEDEGDGES